MHALGMVGKFLKATPQKGGGGVVPPFASADMHVTFLCFG